MLEMFVFRFTGVSTNKLKTINSEVGYFCDGVELSLSRSVAQPFYTRGTLNIVEESWRHTNRILHIVGRGEMVYGIDWQRQLLINRPQPKNVLFDVHNYPYLLLRHFF
jgi:hypothetical protein